MKNQDEHFIKAVAALYFGTAEDRIIARNMIGASAHFFWTAYSKNDEDERRAKRRSLADIDPTNTYPIVDIDYSSDLGVWVMAIEERDMRRNDGQ